MIETSRPPQFETKFENVKTVDSFGGTVEYVDIQPDFTSDKPPILVASGWSEGRKSFHDTGEELFTRGRRALLVDHARSGEVPGQESEFTSEVLHKANSLIAVLDDAGIEQADVIAHSEGALNAVVAAMQHPERFKSLVLAMPAGMIGEDSVLRLAGRFAPKIARSLTKDTVENPRIGLSINTGGAAYIAKNPAKASREVKAMANTTIDQALSELREKGVRIGVLQSNADTVFPADRIQDNIRLEGQSINVDAYASVIAENAGHDELLIHPERSTYGALQMIDQFD